jgi:hypothetical protein
MKIQAALIDLLDGDMSVVKAEEVDAEGANKNVCGAKNRTEAGQWRWRSTAQNAAELQLA